MIQLTADQKAILVIAFFVFFWKPFVVYTTVKVVKRGDFLECLVWMVAVVVIYLAYLLLGAKP